ncbi:hypothetical protein [Burkholderia stagnalis]|uniref:hypothetical protein n=1 Tax=Burkholderia stagnalis TaxID=1503054 RepID=UPI0007599451|nr:hypothetical protein [Burkholderia stagnalis]KVM89225.1 hypothetical protein WT07_32160 [Burkholderia stagnalis]KWE03968.1 hypothetical protein WT47_19880 [Burkholderia stagnalis]KWE14330.1 hypothetical protein WT48_18220 [Burkholderia stagnalis]KWO87836.1 hypothetical protein WU00_03285 [Burkholderia stagnalis]
MYNTKSFDFASFVSANPPGSVSGFDYVHTVYKAHGLVYDFIFQFAKLFFPDFKVVGGGVFVSELFSDEEYRNLLSKGKAIHEIQFWMNLLEITGMFDDICSDQAAEIAKLIVDGWNVKLQREFGDLSVPAQVISDNETGEVFVTIGYAKREVEG